MIFSGPITPTQFQSLVFWRRKQRSSGADFVVERADAASAGTCDAIPAQRTSDEDVPVADLYELSVGRVPRH